MKKAYIDGQHSLIGSIEISGSPLSTILAIAAAMFSNDDVILDNVSRSASVMLNLNIIQDLGAKVEWLNYKKILLNCSTIREANIDHKKKGLSLFLIPALLYRFGEAKFYNTCLSRDSYENLSDVCELWRKLGFLFEQYSDYIIVKLGSISGETEIRANTFYTFSISLLSSIFLLQNVNISFEYEDSCLVNMLNQMGASIETPSEGRYRIIGKNLFKGVNLSLDTDKNDFIFFCLATVLTYGNISIKGIEKTQVISFVNLLDKFGVNYEFSKDEFRICSTKKPLTPIETRVSPYYKTLSMWPAYFCLLASASEGLNVLKIDEPYGQLIKNPNLAKDLDYIKKLANLGLRINLKKSRIGIFIEINGITKLQSFKFAISNPEDAKLIVLAALCAQGVTEIQNYDVLEKEFPEFVQDLISLGAHIEVSANQDS